MFINKMANSQTKCLGKKLNHNEFQIHKQQSNFYYLFQTYYRKMQNIDHTSKNDLKKMLEPKP